MAVYSKRQWEGRKGEAYFAWGFEADFGRVIKSCSLKMVNGRDIELDEMTSVSEILQETGVVLARKIFKEHCKTLGYKMVDITPEGLGSEYRDAVIEAINETR